MGDAPEEFASQLKEYFEQFADDEGYVDQDGFTNVLRCLNQDPKDEDVQKIFKDHDADGNQKLDRDEFESWMQGMWKTTDEVIQEFAKSFKTISEGGDSITTEQFMDILTNQGDSRFSEEDAQSIVDEINTIKENGEDERISMQELINYIYGRESTVIAEENTQEESENNDNQEQTEPEENTEDNQEQGEPEQEETEQNQEQDETTENQEDAENQEQDETTENQEDAENQEQDETTENQEDAENQEQDETTENQEDTENQEQDETTENQEENKSGNDEQTESEQQEQGDAEKTEDQEKTESETQQSTET
ncbi:hypothetical protein KUTeg_004767 [Tegillarca granosa]|uniref:EF-hand domain-containing protein n=1 Tax=Tegillarca granosa TaxID=220873 RepID=A0ABQ9FHT6_TEGGR|nr:hypothetical protein KUTeg_004767 [Tegillarca granosa]